MSTPLESACSFCAPRAELRQNASDKFDISSEHPVAQAEGHMSLTITYLNQAERGGIKDHQGSKHSERSRIIISFHFIKDHYERVCHAGHAGVIQTALVHGLLAEAAIRHMGSSAQGPFVSSFNLESDERHEECMSCYIALRHFVFLIAVVYIHMVREIK